MEDTNDVWGYMENNTNDVWGCRLIRPITLIRRYAKFSKIRYNFTMLEYDKKERKYKTELHLGERTYKGEGASRKEARDRASRTALEKLPTPNCTTEDPDDLIQGFWEKYYYKHFNYRKCRNERRCTLSTAV